MPLDSIWCADPSYRRSDRKVKVMLRDCLDCASTRRNPCQFTYELLSSMFDEQQDRGERISTTTLTVKCLRSEFLKRTEPYTEKPEKLWPAFRGTMYHGQLEWQVHPADIAEPRFHVDIPELGHLSGSPDLIAVEAGILYDYKTSRENPRFEYPWKDHVAQNNVNRWLADHATTVDWHGDIYCLDDPEVRAKFIPKEWTDLVVVYIDDKGPKPLRCTRSESVIGKNGRPKNVRVADIWSDEQCEDFIWERYRAAKKALVDKELPPVPDGWEGASHVLCDWCPKRQECLDLQYGVKVELTSK